jgi:hypothetical protein
MRKRIKSIHSFTEFSQLSQGMLSPFSHLDSCKVLLHGIQVTQLAQWTKQSCYTYQPARFCEPAQGLFLGCQALSRHERLYLFAVHFSGYSDRQSVADAKTADDCTSEDPSLCKLWRLRRLANTAHRAVHEVDGVGESDEDVGDDEGGEGDEGDEGDEGVGGTEENEGEKGDEGGEVDEWAELDEAERGREAHLSDAASALPSDAMLQEDANTGQSSSRRRERAPRDGAAGSGSEHVDSPSGDSSTSAVAVSVGLACLTLAMLAAVMGGLLWLKRHAAELSERSHITMQALEPPVPPTPPRLADVPPYSSGRLPYEDPSSNSNVYKVPW